MKKSILDEIFKLRTKHISKNYNKPTRLLLDRISYHDLINELRVDTFYEMQRGNKLFGLRIFIEESNDIRKCIIVE